MAHKAESCSHITWQNEEAEERTPSNPAEEEKQLKAMACRGSPSTSHGCESLAVGIEGTRSFGSASVQGSSKKCANSPCFGGQHD